ncbi:hypothetical protein E2I00_002130, partial [Balaenoptera physalus]
CIDEIKQELKQDNIAVKANAVCKLTYLQMLGYDISWAAFNIIEVMSASKFTFKDLSSPSQYDTGVALTGLSCFVTPDLARDLANDIMTLMSHTKPYIRKKAVLIMYKVFLKYPESLRPAFPRLKEKLEDPDPGVQSAAVNVICELARRNPKNYLSLAPLFFKLMTSSTNNWVLIKIIKLAIWCSDPLGAKVGTSAMSLLYECVNTVIAETQPGVLTGAGHAGPSLQSSVSVLISLSSGMPNHSASIQVCHGTRGSPPRPQGHRLCHWFRRRDQWHLPSLQLCVQKLRILIEDSDQNCELLPLQALQALRPRPPPMLDVAIRVKAIRRFAVSQMSALLDSAHLEPQQTLEAMLRPKVTTLPGHIQAVYVQNVRLPQFVQSADLEAQERASCILQLVKHVQKLQARDVPVAEEGTAVSRARHAGRSHRVISLCPAAWTWTPGSMSRSRTRREARKQEQAHNPFYIKSSPSPQKNALPSDEDDKDPNDPYRALDVDLDKGGAALSRAMPPVTTPRPLADSEKLPVQKHRDAETSKSPERQDIAVVEKKSKKPKRKEKKHKEKEREKKKKEAEKKPSKHKKKKHKKDKEERSKDQKKSKKRVLPREGEAEPVENGALDEEPLPPMSSYSLLAENSYIKMTYDVQGSLQKDSQVTVSVVLENQSSSFLKNMELNVLDSLNARLARPEGSSVHDGVPVPFQLPPGISNEAQFVFTIQSIVTAQKLKGTLSFIAKNDEGSTHEKLDFKLHFTCTSYLVTTPCYSDAFAKLLESGDLSMSSVKVDGISMSFQNLLAKICFHHHFSVVERVDSCASMYSRSIQGHHVCLLVKKGEKSVSVDGKCSDSTLLSNVLEEMKETLVKC